MKTKETNYIDEVKQKIVDWIYEQCVDTNDPIFDRVENEIDKLIIQTQQKTKQEIIEMIRNDFYELEEIEKDFNINQEIIRTRNNLINKIKDK